MDDKCKGCIYEKLAPYSYRCRECQDGDLYITWEDVKRKEAEE